MKNQLILTQSVKRAMVIGKIEPGPFCSRSIYVASIDLAKRKGLSQAIAANDACWRNAA